jgi:hypothetical protein
MRPLSVRPQHPQSSAPTISSKRHRHRAHAVPSAHAHARMALEPTCERQRVVATAGDLHDERVCLRARRPRETAAPVLQAARTTRTHQILHEHRRGLQRVVVGRVAQLTVSPVAPRVDSARLCERATGGCVRTTRAAAVASCRRRGPAARPPRRVPQPQRSGAKRSDAERDVHGLTGDHRSVQSAARDLPHDRRQLHAQRDGRVLLVPALEAPAQLAVVASAPGEDLRAASIRGLACAGRSERVKNGTRESIAGRGRALPRCWRAGSLEMILAIESKMSSRRRMSGGGPDSANLRPRAQPHGVSSLRAHWATARRTLLQPAARGKRSARA